jgi:general secretion pathway protein H
MYHKNEGFTLIELTVVIILVGLLMVFTIPRFHDSVLTDTLKISAREIVSSIYSVRSDAVRENRGYVLKFDLSSDSYWVEPVDMPDLDSSFAKENAKRLPDDVDIKDITIVGEENDLAGESEIRFHRKGYIGPALIRIGSDKGKELTIILRPFLHKIEVVEGRVDPEAFTF